MRRPWLLPLTPLYAAGSALRWMGLKPKRLARPVVSIGNLSAGGTGKTPFTIALARIFQSSGWHVDVLSRGYGRSSDSAAWVDPTGTAEQFGDEPLLIAQEARVYVARQRFEAGRLAESLASGAVAFHLLDDGFQHRQLDRDVDIVLVNSEDLADWLLPAGNLREPLSALRRATVFAVPAGDDPAVERLRALGWMQPVWRFRREMTVPEVSGPVAAFCGIARPQQFFAGLEEHGLTLAAKKVFRDHHRFRAQDLQALAQMAVRSGAKSLVTTEKDRVRIGELASHLGHAPLLTAGLRVVLADEALVAAWLSAKLKPVLPEPPL